MEFFVANTMLVLLCTVHYSTSSIPDDDSLRVLPIKSYPGYMLLSESVTTTQKTTKAADGLDCVLKCIDLPWCLTVNFKIKPESDGIHICELISTGNYTELKHLKRNDNITNFSIKNPCESRTCFDQGSCIALGKQEYGCTCKAGYTGETCETNIDECATHVLSCGQNTDCIDTKGSYKCKCKAGYYYGIVRTMCELTIGLENSTILRNHGNTSFTQTLSGYLDPVLQNSSTSRWIRCWHAASDGWDVTTTFHPQCDNKGPTVTIVRVGNRNVFGGYTDVSWHTTGSYVTAPKAFLYSLYNTNGFQPVKMSAKVRVTAIIFKSGSCGPTFGGGHDLHISNLASSSTNSYTSVFTYDPPPGCATSGYCTVLAGVDSFTVSDVEVFYETTN